MKKTKDDADAIARRQWPRLNPANIPFLKGITLNQGNEAQVVDISRGGALIETDVRLRPQMKIVFKVITTQGTFRITGSVLRSSIKSLHGTPVYQSAIVFENPLTMMDDLEPPATDASAGAVAAAEVTDTEPTSEEEMPMATEAAAETEAATEAEAAAEVEVKLNEAATLMPDPNPEPELEPDLAMPAKFMIGAMESTAETAKTLQAPELPTPAPPREVFERPDIFESEAVNNPAPSDSGNPGAEDGPVAKHEDVLVFNVVAPEGLGISFESSEALNDW